MNIIGENSNNVKELMNILKDHSMTMEEQQIHMLLDQMTEMEKNYKAMQQELASVKMKLNKMQLDNLSQTPTKADNIIPFSTAAKLENNVEEIRTQIEGRYHNLQSIGKSLDTAAKQIIQKFKEIGISALNNVCTFLGIKEKMIQLRDDARSNEQAMKTAIEKIERVESELGAAMFHAGNAVKIMSGKEALTEGSGKENKFFAMLKKLYSKFQAKYAKQYEKFNKAVEKLDTLEKAAQSIRNRDSVREKLADNKKIVEFRNAEKNDMQREKTEMQRDSYAR